jgi:hypothetical protein
MKAISGLAERGAHHQSEQYEEGIDHGVGSGMGKGTVVALAKASATKHGSESMRSSARPDAIDEGSV